MRRGVREEAGQVAVLVAILFIALVFAVALVVNTGLLFVERRAAQEAADAAAFAGALRLAATGDTGLAMQAAVDAAQLNGYSSGVTVNIPPSSGPNAGNSRFVEVLITTNKSAFLAPQWGITAVNARAVAGGGGAPQQALMTLGTGSGSPGITIQNGGVLALYNENAPFGCSYDPTSIQPWVSTMGQDCRSFGGNAQVNSTSTSAGTNLGSPGGLIGPPSTVALSYVGSGGSCTNTPLPDPKFPGASCSNPSLSDPFFPYPKPVPKSEPVPVSPNWCREDTSNLPSSVCATYTGNINGCATSLVLQPGVYTGVLSGTCDYIFKPGVYVFASDKNSGIKNPSGLRVLGNTLGDTFEGVAGQQGPPGLVSYLRDSAYGSCGTSVGNNPRCGVLLFFTYTGYKGTPSGSGCATLSIAGGNTADLAPEPTGTWQGMLVYNDNDSFCAGTNITVGGGAQLNGTSFRGLIYAPKATLVMEGNTSAAVLSQLVVNSINVQNALVVFNVGTAQVRATGALRLTE